MNALIYKALQQFVLDEHDADAWDQIVAKAHATSQAESAFQRVNGSGMTHLVEVAAGVTEREEPELLESAGRHWVMRNAKQVTERLARASGASFGVGVEKDVPQFHTGIGMIFPSLRPPVLDCQFETPHKARMQYVWHRDAFTPFILGLLSALATCFDERLQIQALPVVRRHSRDPRPVSEFVAILPKAA